jgi:hypothetical protein
MKIHRTYNKDEISQSYTVIGVKGKMLPTGSFLAYDEYGQDYFAINSLVESLNNKFQLLIIGKKMHILVIKEIWSGPKWNNKVVQAIAFISESMESINKFKQLSEKIYETKILLGKLRLEELELVNKFHQKLINQHETNIQSIKEFKPNINLNIEDTISNFDKFREEQNLKISEIKETEKTEIELKKNEIDQAMLKLLALRDEYDKMFDQNS